jgi:hypothetical protein
LATTYDGITPEQKLLIEESKVFFVASAAKDLSGGSHGQGPVNCSPKGGVKLHVLDGHRVAYLDFAGSGNETARHAESGGPMTIMVMSTTAADAGIVRLYGRARAIPVAEYPVKAVVEDGPPSEEIGLARRQVIEVKVESALTSCGYGVPVMEFKSSRVKAQHGRRYKEGTRAS